MIRQVMLAVVLPAALAVVTLLIAWRPWRSGTDGRPSAGSPRGHRGPWGPSVAFGMGYAVSFVAESGWPGVVPDERWQWLLPFAVVTAAVGVVLSLVPQAAIGRGVGARTAGAMVAGGLAAAMLRFPGFDGALPRVALGLAVVLLVLSSDTLAVRRPGVAIPVLIMIVFTAASAVIVQARFAKVALTCGAVAAIGGSVFALSLWGSIRGRPATLGRGGAVMPSALLPAVLLCGHAYDYGDVPSAAFVLPALAPLLLWIGELPVIARKGPWAAGIARVLLILAPCVAALLLVLGAGATDDADEDPYGAYGLMSAAGE